ncbi:hypothetical protein A9G28_00785 [Gilliamella sp. Fer1-1]|jgi:hypothetical protein|uniref:hypothetical protein n=1 Tax=unclassified Gilliamella TaxID=2685620 RepID=UPI00080DC28B|nr:hypothetical protein [Gilliamella apicola]OCG24606.1 hypothetical protein A9G46_08395 [Gilliamella apicola]OCG27398.1 hypothetical protein A9G45_08485 [Gilliamella apicola]OCG43273.1 hypothetical protein A9G28_00785 [Gilliamella apicola]
MKKLMIASMVAFLVAGCAQVDSNLSSFSGVTYKDYSNEYKLIDTYTLTSHIDKSMKDIKVCVLQNIRDRNVVLSDNSNDFVGASGRYYSIPSVTVSSSSGARQYFDDDIIVVDGLTQYNNPQSFIPIINYVRYTLSIKQDKDKNNTQYFFNNITQAQSTTGSVPNNGFNPVGNWNGANPSIILNTLNIEKQKVENCLGN